MKNKNSPPTQAQKDWWSEIIEMGCCLTGDPAEIDHIYGGAYKVDGVNIGHWAVIALSPILHRLDKCNRSTNREEFNRVFGCDSYQGINKGVEKQLFLGQCCSYMSYYKKDLPFDAFILNEIMGYSK